jgi:hypothetical protein
LLLGQVKGTAVCEIYSEILGSLDIREAVVGLAMCGTLSGVLEEKMVENHPALGENIQLSPPGPSQFSKSLSRLNF